jgi:hypothetical protein
MKKRGRFDLLKVSDSKRTQLTWKIRRQVQQELLAKKLVDILLNSKADSKYPEIMSLFVEDFTRRAESEIRRKESFDLRSALYMP